MKTTETIKEQRQRREARFRTACGNKSRYLAIEAENALQAVRDNLLEAKKDGSIGIRGATPLYKPKAGMRVITKPDVSFVVSQAYGCGVFLLDGERVLIKEATQEPIFGKFVLKEVVFEFIDSKNKKLKAEYISEGLIYCAEYEMVEP